MEEHQHDKLDKSVKSIKSEEDLYYGLITVDEIKDNEIKYKIKNKSVINILDCLDLHTALRLKVVKHNKILLYLLKRIKEVYKR